MANWTAAKKSHVLIGFDWRITKLRSESGRFYSEIETTTNYEKRLPLTPRKLSKVIFSAQNVPSSRWLECKSGNFCNRTKHTSFFSSITEPLINRCKFNICTYGAAGKKLACPPIQNWSLLKCPTWLWLDCGCREEFLFKKTDPYSQWTEGVVHFLLTRTWL